MAIIKYFLSVIIIGIILIGIILIDSGYLSKDARLKEIRRGMSESEVYQLMGARSVEWPAGTILFKDSKNRMNGREVTGKCVRYSAGFHAAYVFYNPDGKVEEVWILED